MDDFIIATLRYGTPLVYVTMAGVLASLRVIEHRDRLAEHLKQNGIGTKVYYPIPLHRQQCFEYLGYKEGEFPESESAALETLALPVYPELTDEQQHYVVDSIRSFEP